MKSMIDYKMYPKNKEQLIKEIIKVFNDYDNDNLSNEDFISLIRHFNSIFEEEKYLGEYVSNLEDDVMIYTFIVDKNVEAKIGKQRSKTLNKVLSYYNNILGTL